MRASELQRALSDHLLITADKIEPQKAKRELKVSNRFGQSFTYSSVINQEKEPLAYKKALKSSCAKMWLDAMQKFKFQLKIKHGFQLKYHMAKKCTRKMGI